MAIIENRSFIYNLDILSGAPLLLISGHKNYSTPFGLIFTFLMIFSGLFYAIYAFYIYFFESEMTVVQQSENFMATNLTISTKDFLFAFNVFNVSMKLQYFWGKEFDLSRGQNITKKLITDKYTVKLYYTNPETKEVIKEYTLETEYCEVGKNINQKIIDKYNFTDYKNYLCISEKSHAEIVINKTYTTYINVIVSVNLNDTDGGVNRQIEYQNENYITFFMNYLEFQLYTPDDVVSNKNSTHPINYRKNYYFYELVSAGTLKTMEINIKYIDYSSDNGYLIKQLRNFNGFSLDSIQTKIQDFGSMEIVRNIIYNEFRICFNGDDITQYKRTYRKLPEIIADVSSVFSVLITAGQIIVGFLCKRHLEAETMSLVFKSKLFENSKIKLKKINVNGVKNSGNSKSSLIERNNNLVDNSSRENVIIHNKDSKKDSIEKLNNVKNDDDSNILNDDLSQNKMAIKKNLGIEKKTTKKDYNKNIDSHLYNNENNKDNKDNKDKNIDTTKKNSTKFNSKLYSEKFAKLLGVNYNESQNKIIKSRSISFGDYFYYILGKKNKIKVKLIDKLSKILENKLSVEEIIRRAIDLEIIASYIQLKFGKEYNLVNYMKIWVKKDNEFKKLLEEEGKKTDANKLA